MPPRRLIINGRFLSGPLTAVNSVARDLAMALGRGAGDWEVALAVPPALEIAAREFDMPLVVHGRRKGIAWEQLEYPALAQDGILMGFFNTVPLRGRGHVTMLHDAQVFDAPESYGRATRIWRRLLSRRAGARGNFVLAPSEYSRQALLRHGIGNVAHIGVVHNGLGTVAHVVPDPSILSRLDLAPRRYCLALSTLLPHKNIPMLLRAFADPRLADMRLVLFGRATRDDFQAAGMTPGANVTFAGFVSDAELAALYGSARAMLVPSFEEGFGLPALEAMARGAPALVADRAALPEVVGDVGLILSPTQPEAWIRAILDLADSTRFAALTTAGRTRAARFTWDAAADEVFSHLDHWFAPAGPPHAANPSA